MAFAHCNQLVLSHGGHYLETLHELARASGVGLEPLCDDYVVSKRVLSVDASTCSLVPCHQHSCLVTILAAVQTIFYSLKVASCLELPKQGPFHYLRSLGLWN
jgi:hypothetical protein